MSEISASWFPCWETVHRFFRNVNSYGHYRLQIFACTSSVYRLETWDNKTGTDFRLVDLWSLSYLDFQYHWTLKSTRRMFLFTGVLLETLSWTQSQASFVICWSQTSSGSIMLSGRVQRTYNWALWCIFEPCMWSAVMVFINIVAIIMTSHALHLALFSWSIGSLIHSAGGRVYRIGT